MSTRHHRWFSLSVMLAATLTCMVACSKKDATDHPKQADRAAPVDPEVPAIVVAMIDAHGGMAGWRVARTLAFDNAFQMADDSIATKSRVTVDLAKRRAYVDFDQNGERMAWDGKRAWSVRWTQSYPPTVRAIVDCYLINLPWLAIDTSTRVSAAGTDTLWDGTTEYRVVQMSFNPPAPGGPYRLYIDAATKRLHACAFHAAEGREVVVFGDQDRVNGMLLPGHYVIYSADHLPLASGTLAGWSVGGPFDNNKMTPPDSAVVDKPSP